VSKLIYKAKLALAYRDVVRTRVPFLFERMMGRSQIQAKKAAASLRGKERIEVAFLLTVPGMWKLDYVFRLMEQSGRYHPYVVIFPYSHFKGFNNDELWTTVRRTEEFVKERGFEYVIPYDSKSCKWLDIRKTHNPDIVFFTTPYRDILPEYYYYNFCDKLTCYVPYAFQTMNAYKLDYDQIAINLYGLYFAETQIHLGFGQKYSRNGGANFVVSGYPGTEVYLRDDYESADVWKPQPVRKKRVIWAPHHTIDDGDDFQSSTFLVFHEAMLQIAKKYADRVQFAFKPHQLLKFKLYKLWGEQKTDEYFSQWASLENTQLEESGYIDLFIHSDAMIHDSGSFTTEYLYLNKPVMYLVDKENPKVLFNDFGALAFDCHYCGRKVKEIEKFLDEVVLSGNDTMQEKRKQFYDTYLLPPGGVLPSQAILNKIEEMINGEK
jgi:hypothetical protein